MSDEIIVYDDSTKTDSQADNNIIFDSMSDDIGKIKSLVNRIANEDDSISGYATTEDIQIVNDNFVRFAYLQIATQGVIIGLILSICFLTKLR